MDLSFAFSSKHIVSYSQAAVSAVFFFFFLVLCIINCLRIPPKAI